jgi:putative endonuclease
MMRVGGAAVARQFQIACLLATAIVEAMKGYVYILASKRNGTLYTGVTRDLPGRLYEHQNELTPGFTSRYGVKRLVWFEEHDLLTTAITREKTIKKWPRQWKLNLIETTNPDWEDIAHHLLGF